MTPIPVEIVNRTDWWQPYVPPLAGLVGSILVAAAAFYGVHRSIRTNERAIDAADDREWVRWRRNKFLELADEVLHTSDIAASRLRGCLTWRDQDFNRQMAEINNIFSTLPFLGRRISLITDDVDAEVTAIFDRLGELFLFVGENGRRVRDEVLTRQDDEPVINEIDDVAARVKAAQRDFVEAVRETTVALGTAKLKQINSSAAQTD